MRYFNALVLIGTGAVAGNGGGNSIYGLSTVYVAESSSPVTETVIAGSSGILSAAKDQVTATSSTFSGRFVNGRHAASFSGVNDRVANGNANDKSHAVVSSESNIVHTESWAIDRQIKNVVGSVKGYPWLQPGDWNATAFKNFQSKNWNKTDTINVKAEPMKASNVTAVMEAKEKAEVLHDKNHPTMLPAHSRLPLKARSLGAVVKATINGNIVSWTNEYDGSSTPTPGPKPVASFVVPIAPNSTFSPIPSTGSSASSVVAHPVPHPSAFSMATPPNAGPQPISSSTSTVAPLTTVSPYPWNLNLDVDNSTVTTVSFPVPSAIVVPQPLSTSYADTSTVLSTAMVPQPTACASNSAMFDITFDDLPHFIPSSGTTGIPPILNPYGKLYFNNHFGYVPPPSDPFQPRSPPQLAFYRVAGIGINGSPDAGLELPGGMGAGPRASDSAYWINAISVWIGCSDGGLDACNIQISGYTYGQLQPTASQTVIQPPCPGLKNCSLSFVAFHPSFQGISELRFTAVASGKAVDYYMDDLKLEWSNNTCAAQLERSSSE